jgi:hypothetical protein
MTGPTSYIVTALAAISLVACKPAPRYTLHQGTYPENGRTATLRIENASGETEILMTAKTSEDLTVHWWQPIADRKTALNIFKTDKANAKQMQEIKAGTFTY